MAVTGVRGRGWIRLCCLLLVAACAPEREAAIGTQDTRKPLDLPIAVPDSAPTFVYECPDSSHFTARVLRDTAWLYLEAGIVRLPAVASGSGARFSDEGTTYWSKGEEALLETSGHVRASCVHNQQRSVWEHARLRGVDFRGIGQEPGWLIEIDDGRQVVLLLDYGTERVTAPAPEPQVDAATGNRTYEIRTEAHHAHVVVVNEPCQDVMSGEPFPASVTLTVQSTAAGQPRREFKGCGRALR